MTSHQIKRSTATQTENIAYFTVSRIATGCNTLQHRAISHKK